MPVIDAGERDDVELQLQLCDDGLVQQSVMLYFVCRMYYHHHDGTCILLVMRILLKLCLAPYNNHLWVTFQILFIFIFLYINYKLN